MNETSKGALYFTGMSSNLRLVPGGTVWTLLGNLKPSALICWSFRSVGMNFPSFQAM